MAPAVALLVATLVLVAPLVAGAEPSQPQEPVPQEVEAAEAPSPLRPYEAPVFGEPPEVPPLPPEYLSHEEAGIRFLYHPSARDRVRELIEDAVAIREELSAELGGEVLGSVEIRVAVGGADFSRIVPEGSPQGSGVVAFAEAALIVLNLRASLSGGDVRDAFRRGMALLALDEATAARGLPRWFRIGYALHFSGEASLERARSLWWASMQQKLIPLVDLDWYLADRAAYRSVAAAEAAEFVEYLLHEERRASFPQLLAELKAGRSFDQAVRAAYQNDPRGLELMWREHVARHKAFVPILFGGTALWVLLAMGVQLRRRLRARADGEPVSAPRASRRLAKVRMMKLPRPPRSKGEHGRTIETDPDVPKVSHDGRWHTLH